MEDQCSREIPCLNDYDVSPTFGFVEENPRTDLPDYFKPWVDLARQATELIKTGKLREKILQLPVLDHTRLGEDLGNWKAAVVFLTCLTNGYVWAEGEDGIPEVLPRCLAVPFAAVAEKLQVTPSLSNYTFGLLNWKLKDPNGKVELSNLEAFLSIIGGSDESWFLCTATQVELDFAPALCSIIETQKAVREGEVERVIKELRIIEGAICKMKNSLNRMSEGCDPQAFYNVFRPFLAGWDSPAFKKKNLKGLIYEGVSTEPKAYTGGSAAQSSTVPCLDAAFGIAHSESEEKLCKSFQQYMPKLHRDLIDAIRRGPSIPLFVQSCGSPEAVQSFNKCLEALKGFRSCHLQLVAKYIVTMARRKDSNRNFQSQAEAGTGGTGFMTFLRGLRTSTINTMLGQRKNGTTGHNDPVAMPTHSSIEELGSSVSEGKSSVHNGRFTSHGGRSSSHEGKSSRHESKSSNHKGKSAAGWEGWRVTVMIAISVCVALIAVVTLNA